MLALIVGYSYASEEEKNVLNTITVFFGENNRFPEIYEIAVLCKKEYELHVSFSLYVLYLNVLQLHARNVGGRPFKFLYI